MGEASNVQAINDYWARAAGQAILDALAASAEPQGADHRRAAPLDQFHGGASGDRTTCPSCRLAFRDAGWTLAAAGRAGATLAVEFGCHITVVI